MNCQAGREIFAEKDELWAAEQLGEVIAFASKGGYLAAEGMREGIAQCVKHTGKWSIDRPNHVGLPYQSVLRWTNGTMKPSVQGLLALASMCGARLLDILSGTANRHSAVSVCHYYYPGVRGSNKALPCDSGTVQAALNALIQEEGIQCVTGRRLAGRLNASEAWLAENHPQEWNRCQRIRMDNRRILTAQRESELEGLVLAAARRVRLAGEPLTSYRVHKAMTPIPQRYGAREVQKAINRCIEHLISTRQ